MSRYILHICYILTACLFFYFGSSQLPPNQVTTMTRLYDMIRSDAGNSSYPWRVVNRDSNPCMWDGVSCSSDNSFVAGISLPWFSISSSDILPVLCQLDALEALDLSNNHLSSIPDGFISGCGQLKLLNFSMNRLEGSLPDFDGLKVLEVLDLSFNSFDGNISSQLNGLDLLKSLNLSANKFAGSVPTNLGGKNHLILEELQMSNNSFQGEFPAALMSYGNLSLIDLSHNNISGSITDRLDELSKLQILVLSGNNFSGGIPDSLLNVQTLTRFSAYGNSFTGFIPVGITKHGSYLDLSSNRLIGTIPRDLLSQPNLQCLNLSFNMLQGPIPTNISSNLSRLSLRGNSLNGTIPSTSLGCLTELMYLELDNNNLTGIIPPELGFCTRLVLLNLAQNELSGVLPEELGNLTELRGIYLQHNNLVGSIPDQFTQLHSLLKMNISSNLINGSIPNSVSRMQNLTNLDLCSNSLSGSIPSSIGSLNSLIELQLGNNQLRGDIPFMPTSLIVLNLSHNLFEGPIPKSFARLSELEVLDLSDNEFSGVIPDFLTSMAGLTQLVLSNNQLSGDVPKFGSHVTVVRMANGTLRNQSSETPTSTKRKKTTPIWLKLGLPFCFGILVVGFISASWKYAQIDCYTNEPLVQWIVNETREHVGLDFKKVVETVNRPANMVIKGDLCSYYRALMPSGTCFWIKKLYWTSRTSTLVNPDRFEEELKALSQLSNAYIMLPLGYALTETCAFMVYDCPQYGTLFDLLHGNDHSILTWENRYTIAIGVVTGLSYLHSLHDSDSAPNTLIHVSSRSIFMRSFREPLIGDVELIKVVNPSESLGTLSVVAGSVGYVPPEYAYTMRVTKSGNIYGVGTILLELLTGKKAVEEGVELAKWAMSKSIPAEILDTRIPEAHEQMVSMLRISLSCVSICPEERPDATQLQTMVLNVAHTHGFSHF